MILYIHASCVWRSFQNLPNVFLYVSYQPFTSIFRIHRRLEVTAEPADVSMAVAARALANVPNAHPPAVGHWFWSLISEASRHFLFIFNTQISGVWLEETWVFCWFPSFLLWHVVIFQYPNSWNRVMNSLHRTSKKRCAVFTEVAPW